MVDEVLVLLPLVALIHRIFAAAVALVKHVVARQTAGQQAFHQRPVDHDGDVLFAAPGDRALLDVALQHVVWQLHRRNRTHGVEGPQLLERAVRGADRACFARFHQFAKRPGRFFDRHVFVRRVEIQQLDAIGAQPTETFVALGPQPLWPAVGDHLAAFVVDATLGGDDHFVAPARNRARDELFALAVRTVDVGRIEMVDAQIEAGLDRGDAVGLVGVERRHSGDRPAAERDR